MGDPYANVPPADTARAGGLAARLALPSWAALQVTGADARSFLQGQLSCDVSALSAGEGCFAAYSSPKGRMLALVRASAIEDGIELRMPAALVEAIERRLRLFVLRSKVTLTRGDAGDPACALPDRIALIEAGVPVVYPQTQDQWVAQMANLDLIGGISFTKGCYTGQEVIARLHYLGRLKRRMFRVRGEGEPPSPGSAILDAKGDAQSVGEIVDAVPAPAGFVASAVLQVTVASAGTLRLERDGQAALDTPEAWDYVR